MHVDGSDAVLLTFLDIEGDNEALQRGIVFAHRRDDAHVRITPVEIEAAQQVAVRFDAVLIIDVGRLQEAQPVALAGLDDILQPVRRIGAVSDEIDALDAGLLSFGDLVDEIDAVVRQFDDLRHHTHVIAAGAPIDLDDALGIRLNHRARESTARLGLNLERELLVLELFIAFEGDAVEDRIFHHRHHQATARLADAHVLEQTRRVERFQTGIDRCGVPALEIGTDGVGLDAAVAFNDDAGGLRKSRRGCQ